MKQGCKNFKSLEWANPTVDYEIVECPSELKQHPPCWNENGGHWPSSRPAKCASPYGLESDIAEDESDDDTEKDETTIETEESESATTPIE